MTLLILFVKSVEQSAQAPRLGGTFYNSICALYFMCCSIYWCFWWSWCLLEKRL